MTFTVKSIEVLNRVEKSWTRNGFMPLTPKGAFPLNAAFSVTRISERELHVINTEGNFSKFVVK